MKIKSIFVMILLLQLSLFAQSQNNPQNDSVATIIQSDTIVTEVTDDTNDSSTVSKSLDTIAETDLTNSNSKPEAISSGDSAKVKPEVKLQKRKYNHREQVIFASGMMAFIAIILATAQNWNPD